MELRLLDHGAVDMRFVFLFAFVVLAGRGRQSSRERRHHEAQYPPLDRDSNFQAYILRYLNFLYPHYLDTRSFMQFFHELVENPLSRSKFVPEARQFVRRIIDKCRTGDYQVDHNLLAEYLTPFLK